MSGRPPEFDEADVLDAAMRTFWERGYTATGYADLVMSTGLGRQSLYCAFGDKRALFSRVLQHYSQQVTQQSLDILGADGSPLKRIGKWLNRLRNRSLNQRIGCLLTNTAVEIAPHDSTIGRWVNAELKKIERSLKDVLNQSIRSGELSSRAQPENLASYLLGVAQGVMVMGRCGASRRQLKSLTDTALGVLQELQTSELRIADID